MRWPRGTLGLPSPRRRILTVTLATVILSLHLSSPAVAVPPANDNFANRSSVATLPYTDTQNTADATVQAAEQQPSCAPIGKTVWYQFVPGSTTTLQADTFGSDFDTVIGIWTGTTLGSLTQVGCDDDSGPELSSVETFQATSGTTYLFQVGGYEGEFGSLTFHLGPPTVGAVSGTVTAASSGTPLEAICVDVVEAATGDFVAFAETDSAGDYVVEGLLPGNYKVLFSDWCDASTDYLSEWYDNKPTEATADQVTVAAATTTSGIDAALALGGSISGRVTAQGGGPLPFICVDVYDLSGEFVGWADTNGAGQYVVGGLPTGQYKVQFYDDCDESEDYREEWYNDQGSFDTATPVSVTAPNTTTGVDAALASLFPPPPPQPKTVTLTARPRKVDRGDRTRLTAVVSPCAGHEGDVVEFYRGGTKIATKPSDATCTAKVRVRVRKTARFRAVSPQQDDDHLAGTSAPVKVRVV